MIERMERIALLLAPGRVFAAGSLLAPGLLFASRPLRRRLLVLALTVFPFAASAQEGTALLLRIPPSYRSFTLKTKGSETETKISQLYVPVTASVRFGNRADLILSAASAFASSDSGDGSSQSLNGASDVKAQLFLRFLENRFLVQGGVSAPTGKKELDPEEYAVARYVSHPLLGFRLKRYGQGWDANGGAALAFSLADGVDVGLGGGFTAHGAYTLLQNGSEYKPGAETSASAGIDLRGSGDEEDASGPALRLDAAYRTYAVDQYDGKDIFDQGDQTEVGAEGRIGGSGPRALVSLRTVLLADNKAYSGIGDQLSEIRSRSGTAMFAQGGLDFPLGGRTRAGLDGEWTHFEGSDEPGNDGDTYGGGPVLRIAMGENGWLSLGGRYLLGTITGTGSGKTAVPDIDLSGFHVTAGFQWRGEP